MLNVIFYSLIGGVFSLVGGIALLGRGDSAYKLAGYVTPFAAGVLLSAAFLDTLPEALSEHGDMKFILKMVLFGILIFFLLERFLRWFHHHHEHGVESSKNSLIIIGDTLHNAIDGVAIAAGFLISTPTGIITTIAVAAHEIPQEVGDFGLLLKNGMAKGKVLLVNLISAVATTVTAVITYAVGSHESFPVAPLLAITTGFFIYIASSDIIPEIHEGITKGKFDIRPWLLIFGVILMMVITPIADSYISGHGDDHASNCVEKSLDTGNNMPSDNEGKQYCTI
ncbi:ZIP family metal transporter [Candidatus Saccharibacteria bacterium]|nr:ZIP family metal transporter [Candidatus Saccharibacteria bacterium]